MGIIFLSQGEAAPRYIWTKYDLVCTTAYLVKTSLLQLALTLFMLADTSWKTGLVFFFRFRHVTWGKYMTVLKQNFHRQFRTNIRVPLGYVILLFQAYDRFFIGLYISDFRDRLSNCFFCQWNYIIVLIQEAAWLCQNMSVICSFCDFKYCLSNDPTLFTSILK